MIPMVVSEWQLISAAWDEYGVGPVLPEEIVELLPELVPYVSEGVPGETNDFCHIERGNSLCLAMWLHHLNMYSISGPSNFELSMVESDHLQGQLLRYFLSSGTSDLSYEEIVDFCIRENKYENWRDLEREQEKSRLANQALIKCRNALRKAEERYLEAPKHSMVRHDRRHKKNLLEVEVKDCKEEIYQRQQQEEYLECLL